MSIKLQALGPLSTRDFAGEADGVVFCLLPFITIVKNLDPVAAVSYTI